MKPAAAAEVLDVTVVVAVR